MKALILIDIQNDFIPGGALAVPDGDAIIPIVNQLQEHFELVIATQDWHPADHKSFASAHKDKKPFEVISLHNSPQTLWPDHCVQGTTGSAFSNRLHGNKTEAIFRKGTDREIDSYSGFYDNGRRKSTGLTGYLRDKKVTEVYLTGLAGDICVYYTAMDSLSENFITYIIEDAVRPLSSIDFEKNKNNFLEKGGKLILSSQIL